MKKSDTIKFAFITDTHIDNNYGNRVDDAQLSILSKISQSYKLAEKNGCQFMIHGGDVFNRVSINEKKNSIFNRLRKIIVTSKIPSYFILGQHDINYSFETYEKSSLKMLSESCDGKFELLKEKKEINGCLFVPSHVYDDVQEVCSKIEHFETPVVAVAHCLLYDTKSMFNTISVAETSLKTENINLVLSGDLHCGFKFQKHNKTYFYNPGSLLRKARDQKDRIPKVAIFTISQFFGNWQIELEEIELDCLNGNACFTPEKEERKEVSKELEVIEKNDITDFTKELSSVEVKSISIFDFLNERANAENLDKKVLDRILSYQDKIDLNNV